MRWLQGDPELATAFAKQALIKEEYLLVCDVYEEAVAYWDSEAELNPGGLLKAMVELRSHYATARTRLGFTRSARNILEPLADNPNLGRIEQAGILLQIGDIVREESQFVEFGDIPGAFFESMRDEDNIFTHPPRSVIPGVPGSCGSYFAVHP